MYTLSNDNAEITSHIVPEHTDTLKMRDMQLLMEMPFFSISKSPVFESRTFDNGNVRIEVKSGELGLPTMWDKDLLIYIALQRNKLRTDRSHDVYKVSFRAHDFFSSCGRSSGGRSYESLVSTLNRLSTTSITMAIATERGQIEDHAFSWIKSVRMSGRAINGNRALGEIEVEVDRRLWHAIDEDQSILARDSEYFKLTSGLARRVYELARANIGSSASWSVDLERLSKLTGYSDDEKRYFKRYIVQLAAANSLPDYRINISLKITRKGSLGTSKVRGISNLKMTFTRRNSIRKPDTTCDVSRPAIIIKHKVNAIKGGENHDPVRSDNDDYSSGRRQRSSKPRQPD